MGAISAKAYDAVTALVGGTISLFSPRRACMYRHGRTVYRTYAAGEPTGPNAAWRPRNRSADANIKRANKYLLGRVRDLAENSSYISGAIDRICNNVVRSGIRPQARVQTASGKPNSSANRRLEKLWARWARHADIAGILTFAAIQRLCLRHDWIDGEILIHRVWDDSMPGVVPLRLEVLECDHLDATVDGELDNGNVARRGIELDRSTGRPVAYHILPTHPGDYLYQGQRKSIRIPAEDIIHLYDPRRASQSRGISRLAAIVMESYDLAEYKTAERIGARLAAAFGVFIKTNFPELAPGIGAPSASQDPTASSSSGTPSWSDMPDYIDPGRIQALPVGTEIQVAEHNRPGTQYEPYVRDSVRSMSVGAGMSYESFSNDYTNASYSSARSASLEERISYQGQQQYLNERLNSRVWAWFLDAAVISGLAPALPGFAGDPWPYYEAVSWQNPGWTWVDPLKDSKAAELGIGLVTTTRSRIAAQMGEDWEETLEQSIAEEEKLARLYELRRKNNTEKQNNDTGTETTD